MAILTDTKARNLKPTDKAIAHGGVPGLMLEPPSKKGYTSKKSRGKWVFRFTSPVLGIRRKTSLGTYPDVGIAEAGKRAQSMREIVAAGKDPIEEKRRAKHIKLSMPTFKEAATQVHADLKPGWKNAKHALQWISTLEQYVFPKIGNKPLNEIEPTDIAEVLRPIWLEKAETAGRVKQRIHAVMAWSWVHKHCASNPVDAVNYLLPQQPDKTVRSQHQPAMPWRDVPEFVVTHLRSGVHISVTCRMLEFLILTACRSGEVRGMRWSEVDWQQRLWIIPTERMKAKLSHQVPLSPRACAILEQQRGQHEELVFPSPRDQVELSDMALTSFLRKHQIKSDTPGRVATAHGFRSSFRDWCSEHEYSRDLAERALAHTIANKVEAAYHRTDLLEQRRPMMEAWATFVTGDSGGVK